MIKEKKVTSPRLLSLFPLAFPRFDADPGFGVLPFLGVLFFELVFFDGILNMLLISDLIAGIFCERYYPLYI